jgi:cell division septation protein DedD
MKTLGVLATGVLFLGGCALPLPVQVASWALDGLSYVTTEKSMADHGLSIVANKDCAVVRGILMDEGQICRDFDDYGTGTAVAANDFDRKAAQALAEFETAAGGDATAKGQRTNRRPIIEPQVRMSLARIHKPMTFEDGVRLSGYPLVITVEPIAEPVTQVAARKIDAGKAAGKADDVVAVADFSTAAGAPSDATTTPTSGVKPWRAKTLRPVDDAAGDTEPVAGLYFVIGSFREHQNALKLRSQFRGLTPAVLVAKLDEGMVYRVVVGPFEQRQAKTVHQRIYRAGIIDSWAIRVTPGEWTMAMVTPPAKSPLLADLNPEDSRWDPIDYVRKLAQWIY